jgi:nucleotide-binding universal stress UspA family protein
MAIEPISPTTDNGPPGLVLFAYDGSDQAKSAIREAACQLGAHRHAIVLSVWQPIAALPFGVARVPPPDLEGDMEDEAAKVADEGARLARSVGFAARPLAETGNPVWRVIVDAADAHDAGIVVLGSHGRSGIGLVLMGSVASAVSQHTKRPVLIVHSPAAERAA